MSTNGIDHGTRLIMWCPGCDDVHSIEIENKETKWQFDGDLESPTITPSIKVSGTQWNEGDHFHKPNHQVAPGQPTTCHSFVTAGQWQFLGDCTHVLAGQTVDMVDLPDWSTDW
jgi:hypothetical protein